MESKFLQTFCACCGSVVATAEIKPDDVKPQIQRRAHIVVCGRAMCAPCLQRHQVKSVISFMLFLSDEPVFTPTIFVN